MNLVLLFSFSLFSPLFSSPFSLFRSADQLYHISLISPFAPSPSLSLLRFPLCSSPSLLRFPLSSSPLSPPLSLSSPLSLPCTALVRTAEQLCPERGSGIFPFALICFHVQSSKSRVKRSLKSLRPYLVSRREGGRKREREIGREKGRRRESRGGEARGYGRVLV